VLVIAGPNGSGKSTLINLLQNDPTVAFPDNYINADDIARSLAAEIPDLDERNHAAFLRAEELRQALFRRRESFAFETVMSHPSKIVLMKQLRSAGYHVAFYFVCTATPDINVQRVRGRILAGGHSVPEDRIVARWYRTVQLLPCAVEAAHEAAIYDSTILPTKFKVGLIEAAPDLVPSEIPTWIQSSLLTVLAERVTSRLHIAEWAAPRVVETPDEASGETTGLIVRSVPEYYVQELEEGRLVRHDARLLKGECCEGRQVRIAYTDGVGAVA
jgi:predicted ABC-type ATPase